MPSLLKEWEGSLSEGVSDCGKPGTYEKTDKDRADAIRVALGNLIGIVQKYENVDLDSDKTPEKVKLELMEADLQMDIALNQAVIEHCKTCLKAQCRVQRLKQAEELPKKLAEVQDRMAEIESAEHVQTDTAAAGLPLTPVDLRILDDVLAGGAYPHPKYRNLIVHLYDLLEPDVQKAIECQL